MPTSCSRQAFLMIAPLAALVVVFSVTSLGGDLVLLYNCNYKKTFVWCLSIFQGKVLPSTKYLRKVHSYVWDFRPPASLAWDLEVTSKNLLHILSTGNRRHTLTWAVVRSFSATPSLICTLHFLDEKTALRHQRLCDRRERLCRQHCVDIILSSEVYGLQRLASGCFPL